MDIITGDGIIFMGVVVIRVLFAHSQGQIDAILSILSVRS